MIHQCWPLWVPEMACVNYNYDWPNPCSCCLPDRWDQQVQPILFRCGDGYMYGTLRNSLFSTSKLAKSWLWLIDWLIDDDILSLFVPWVSKVWLLKSQFSWSKLVATLQILLNYWLHPFLGSSNLFHVPSDLGWWSPLMYDDLCIQICLETAN